LRKWPHQKIDYILMASSNRVNPLGAEPVFLLVRILFQSG